MDPFHFSLPDPDAFHEKDPASKKSVKLWKSWKKRGLVQNDNEKICKKNIYF